MCFSAEASFGASIVLGGIGYMAFKKAKTSSQQVFAMIPIFFAIQQFTEGLIWIDLLNMGDTSSIWLKRKIGFFLFFAWVVWPIFIPYSLSLLEINSNRKKILQLFTVFGIVVSITTSFVFLSYGVTGKIDGYHILYELDYKGQYDWIIRIFYTLTVLISCFVSTVRGMNYLGIINLVSFIISKLVFKEYLISTWCYFAAISSVIILFIIIKLPIGERSKVSLLAKK